MTTAITPSQGLTVSNYVNFFVSPAPGTGTGVITVPLLSTPEWALYRQMYDQCRVSSVTMKLIPRASMTEQSNLITLNDTSYLTAGKNVYYTVEDRDGYAPGSIPVLKKYASVKVHRNDKVMSRTYRVKYDGPNSWFDCQNPSDLPEVQQALGLFGGMTVYGESFIERSGQILNSVWADLELTYQVSFRGKALVSIAVTEDGAVTLSQTPVGTLEAIQIFKGNDEIDHFGSVDLSGNQIGTFSVAPEPLAKGSIPLASLA